MLPKKLSGLGTVVPALVPVLLLGLGEPVFARTPSIAELHETVQNAVCLNDWNQAISAINRLIASDAASPAYREQMVALRQQLSDYRAQGTVITMNQQPQCTGATTPRPTAPVTHEFRRPLDWDAAIARFARSQATVPTTVAGRRTPETFQERSRDINERQRVCSAVPQGYNRVASGSVSNRWRYDILQRGSSFSGRYWLQEDCGSMGRTGGHRTQDDAYDAILAGTQNSRESLGRVREEGADPMPEWIQMQADDAIPTQFASNSRLHKTVPPAMQAARFYFSPAWSCLRASSRASGSLLASFPPA